MNCSWCGAAVDPDDGWQLAEVAGPGQAAFCRLEHIVPWQMQGTKLEVGKAGEDTEAGGDTTGGAAAMPAVCSECGTADCGGGVVLIRHRGEHRIVDLFCSTDHLAAWSKVGGPWR